MGSTIAFTFLSNLDYQSHYMFTLSAENFKQGFLEKTVKVEDPRIGGSKERWSEILSIYSCRPDTELGKYNGQTDTVLAIWHLQPSGGSRH